ncbi:hypothetical protein ACFX1R_003337 [Malus domestica]
MPNAFNDLAKVTISHIPAANTPVRIDVPHIHQQHTWEGQTVPEDGEAAPSMRQGTLAASQSSAPTLKRGRPLATDIMLSDDIKPCSIDECRCRTDWSNWKQAIQVELDSLAKRKVFGLIVPTPPRVKPVGYKWVFLMKRNEKNEIVRYKARFVAQSFSQRPGIDYEETYSSVMDVITFRYLISLVVFEKLNMQLMDMGYVNNELCPCVFIKKSHSRFAIVTVYVDDMNLIGTPAELEEIATHLKSKFKMKDIGKTRIVLAWRLSIVRMES